MYRKRAPFTEEQDAMLIEAYRKQATYPEMCKQLQRTEGSIKNRLSFLRRSGELENKPKGKKPAWTDEQKAELVRLHNTGSYSRAEIGKLIGKNGACVQAQCNKMRLVKPREEYERAANHSHKNSKLKLEEKPKREAVLISPVHYMNAQPKQCRHFVTRVLMCGKPANGERCAEHRS